MKGLKKCLFLFLFLFSARMLVSTPQCFKNDAGVWHLRVDEHVSIPMPVESECVRLGIQANKKFPVIAIIECFCRGGIPEIKFDPRPSSEVVTEKMEEFYARLGVSLRVGSVVQYKDTFVINDRIGTYIRIWNYITKEYVDVDIKDLSVQYLFDQVSSMFSPDGKILRVSVNNQDEVVYEVPENLLQQ